MKWHAVPMLYTQFCHCCCALPLPPTHVQPSVVRHSQGLAARRQIMAQIRRWMQRRPATNGDTTRPADCGMALILRANGGRRADVTALELLFAGHLPTSSAACSLLMFLAANPSVSGEPKLCQADPIGSFPPDVHNGAHPV